MDGLATIESEDRTELKIKMIVTRLSKETDPDTRDVYLLPSIDRERTFPHLLMGVVSSVSGASTIDMLVDLSERIRSGEPLDIDDIRVIRKLFPKFLTQEQSKVILNALKRDVERKKLQYTFPGIVFDPLDEEDMAESKECSIHQKLSLYLKIWIRAEFRVRNKVLWENYLSNKYPSYDQYLQDSIEMFSVLLSQ